MAGERCTFGEKVGESLRIFSLLIFRACAESGLFNICEVSRFAVDKHLLALRCAVCWVKTSAMVMPWWLGRASYLRRRCTYRPQPYPRVMGGNLRSASYLLPVVASLNCVASAPMSASPAPRFGRNHRNDSASVPEFDWQDCGESAPMTTGLAPCNR